MIKDVGHWRKIIIQRFAETKDDFGSAVKAWTTFKTIYANVTPISGREMHSSNRENIIRSASFYIYFDSTITVKDRISYNSETYDITYIRELGRRESMEISGEVRK